MQNKQNMQNMQNMQNKQNMQNMQKVQDMQNLQNRSKQSTPGVFYHCPHIGIKMLRQIQGYAELQFWALPFKCWTFSNCILIFFSLVTPPVVMWIKRILLINFWINFFPQIACGRWPMLGPAFCCLVKFFYFFSTPKETPRISLCKTKYCGFWSNRTLPYFPLSSSSSVRPPSQAWHINFSLNFDGFYHENHIFLKAYHLSW